MNDETKRTINLDVFHYPTPEDDVTDRILRAYMDRMTRMKIEAVAMSGMFRTIRELTAIHDEELNEAITSYNPEVIREAIAKARETLIRLRDIAQAYDAPEEAS